jgi:hypothetical protein
LKTSLKKNRYPNKGRVQQKSPLLVLCQSSGEGVTEYQKKSSRIYITLDHFFLFLQSFQDLVKTQSSNKSNSLGLPHLQQKISLKISSLEIYLLLLSSCFAD